MIVGPHTAYKWYASGCRTLDDVKQRRGGIIVSPIQEVSFFINVQPHKTNTSWRSGSNITMVSSKFDKNRSINTFILIIDINSRMPRSEAKEIFELIKHIGAYLDLGQF